MLHLSCGPCSIQEARSNCSNPTAECQLATKNRSPAADLQRFEAMWTSQSMAGKTCPRETWGAWRMPGFEISMLRAVCTESAAESAYVFGKGCCRGLCRRSSAGTNLRRPCRPALPEPLKEGLHGFLSRCDVRNCRCDKCQHFLLLSDALGEPVWETGN